MIGCPHVQAIHQQLHALQCKPLVPVLMYHHVPGHKKAHVLSKEHLVLEKHVI